jgi:hypothetical protein
MRPVRAETVHVNSRARQGLKFTFRNFANGPQNVPQKQFKRPRKTSWRKQTVKSYMGVLLWMHILHVAVVKQLVILYCSPMNWLHLPVISK